MNKDMCEEHGRIRCDICAYISELKEQASIAELAYRGLAEIAVTRGEYQSLLDKHTAMTKAHRAEKERGDKAEERIKELLIQHANEHTERGRNIRLRELAEAREQKLRELITEILGDTSSLDYLNREKTQRLVEGYLSLYPKEDAV